MRKYHSFRNRKAFTLVEIIVVIAILGLFASIVTVSASSLSKSSELKSATSAIKAYWDTTNDYFFQLNSGFASKPSLTQMKARLGDKVQGIGENPPSSLSSNKIYIQYKIDKTNVHSKYMIVRITYRYGGKYYYSVDGNTVIGPKTSL